MRTTGAWVCPIGDLKRKKHGLFLDSWEICHIHKVMWGSAVESESVPRVHYCTGVV